MKPLTATNTYTLVEETRMSPTEISERRPTGLPCLGAEVLPTVAVGVVLWCTRKRTDTRE
jgi:hypothetical protein